MPERHVAISSEGMPGIGRYDNQVAGFGDDVNAADGVDTTPRVDDEHLAAGVAMLGSASTWRTVADRDSHGSESVVVAVSELNRSPRRVLKGAHVRPFDQGLQRLDHRNASFEAVGGLGTHIMP